MRLALVGKIGENMSIRRFQRFENAGKLATYLHGTRIGVIVEFDGGRAGRQGRRDARRRDEAGVAVVRPTCRRDLIEKERSRRRTQKAAESGKPAEIVAKMVEGSVQKYLKEVSLLNQTFVKNDKQTVEQMLKAANTTSRASRCTWSAKASRRRSDDFAAEVAAQVAAAKQ